MHVDINCDMGESFGRYTLGNDELVFPYISSANIACGFHGGDPVHIERTIDKAIEHGVVIGAHPSYPDLVGFGRRYMKIDMLELKSILKYQIAALKGLVESKGAPLVYVKPHGALYNQAAHDAITSSAIIAAIKELDDQLILMGLAGSVTEAVAKANEQPFVAEGFADRRYEADGQLMSRTKEGAVITDAKQAAEQALYLVKYQQVQITNGSLIPVEAVSICIHGDNPNVGNILIHINEAFKAAGVKVKSFAQ